LDHPQLSDPQISKYSIPNIQVLRDVQLCKILFF
jgi:hypothetical protein